MIICHFALLLITNDGGPGHFAAMTRIPAIILYGPETPLLHGPLSSSSFSFYPNVAKVEDAASIDTVLLFGVIPFPSLPLNRLLPEIHRVIKPEGSLAVWLFPVSGWVPNLILQSVLFTYVSKRNGVYNYRRC